MTPGDGRDEGWSLKLEQKREYTAWTKLQRDEKDSPSCIGISRDWWISVCWFVCGCVLNIELLGVHSGFFQGSLPPTPSILQPGSIAKPEHGRQSWGAIGCLSFRTSFLGWSSSSSAGLSSPSNPLTIQPLDQTVGQGQLESRTCGNPQMQNAALEALNRKRQRGEMDDISVCIKASVFPNPGFNLNLQCWRYIF